MMHEMMHTMGVFHEHNRIDRDFYVTIFEDHIANGIRRSGHNEWQDSTVFHKVRGIR